MSVTQLRQNAEPQHELKIRSVGVSSQISHTVEPFATAGPRWPVAAWMAWFFFECTILEKHNRRENKISFDFRLKKKKSHLKILSPVLNVQIGMIYRLAHLGEKIKNVSIVVQKSAFCHVVIERTLRLCV